MLVKIKSVSIRALRFEEEDRLLICKIASSTRSSNVVPRIFYSPPLFFSLSFPSVFHSLLSFSSASSSPSSSPPILRPLSASSFPFLGTACAQVGPLSRDYLKYRGQNNGISIARNAADVYLQLFIAPRCSTQRNHAPGQSNPIVERMKETVFASNPDRTAILVASLEVSFFFFPSSFFPTFVFSSTDFHDSNFIRLNSDLPFGLSRSFVASINSV